MSRRVDGKCRGGASKLMSNGAWEAIWIDRHIWGYHCATRPATKMFKPKQILSLRSGSNTIVLNQ